MDIGEPQREVIIEAPAPLTEPAPAEPEYPEQPVEVPTEPQKVPAGL